MPSAPTSVQTPTAVAGAPRCIKAAWSVPTNNGATPILRYALSSVPSQNSTSCQGMSCTLCGLLPGVTYQYTVAAVNSVGTGSAATSGSFALPGAFALVLHCFSLIARSLSL